MLHDRPTTHVAVWERWHTNPSRNKTLKCRFNVGPPSTPLKQHYYDTVYIQTQGILKLVKYTCLMFLILQLLSNFLYNHTPYESGFRPPLCTYRLNWARRTSWGWWDDWDDTVLQTQDSKFEPWRSEAEHATSRSRRLPTILTFTRGWGSNNFVSFKPPRPGTEPRTLAWKAAVLTTTLGPPPIIHPKLAKKKGFLTYVYM